VNATDRTHGEGYFACVIEDADEPKIRQRAYVALRSETTSRSEMTACLGVEPDRAAARGSLPAEPPRPACHSWEAERRAPELTVDEQMSGVLAEPDIDEFG